VVAGGAAPRRAAKAPRALQGSEERGHGRLRRALRARRVRRRRQRELAGAACAGTLRALRDAGALRKVVAKVGAKWWRRRGPSNLRRRTEAEPALERLDAGAQGGELLERRAGGGRRGGRWRSGDGGPRGRSERKSN
jgi:hypothetical protein